MTPILLLHGAIGAASQLIPLKNRLSNSYADIHLLNFSGHGGEGMPDGAFSIPIFAEDVRYYIEKNNLERVNIFGYSMGGYAGMYLAKKYPEKINKIITLATKFHWDEDIAAKEMQQLNPDKIAGKVPAFAAALQERHAPNDWKVVLSKTASMLEALGKNNALQLSDYTDIKAPCLLLLGDRDKMITIEETLQVYKTLPQAQMGMLPHTPHPIEQVNLKILSAMIENFYE